MKLRTQTQTNYDTNLEANTIIIKISAIKTLCIQVTYNSSGEEPK
jgi:hypothetical protein